MDPPESSKRKVVVGKMPFRPRPDESDDYTPPVKHHGMNREILRGASTLPDVLTIADYENGGTEGEPFGTVRRQQVIINPREWWIKRHDPGTKVQPMQRKAYSTSGKETEVLTNAWPITKFPTKPVYQYEVILRHDNKQEEGRRVLKRAFNCKTRKDKLPDAIYDGARMAWSTHYIDEFFERMEFTGGKNGRMGTRKDIHGEEVEVRFICRRKVYLKVINAWLKNKRPLDEYVIDALNFLDHLLRQGPSQRQTVSKRAFFFETLKDHPEAERLLPAFEFSLGRPKGFNQGYGAYGFVACYQGVIQMIRPCVSGLLLNLDTAHGVFWPRANLLWICRRLADISDETGYIRLHPTQNKITKKREFNRVLANINNRIRRLRVTPDNYYSKFNGSFTIKRLFNENTETYMIDYKDPATGKITKMSVEDYFLRRYNYELEDPSACLVQMDRHNIVFPLECLKVERLQRWEAKLTDKETANMINFTAKRPAKRLEMIRTCKGLLDHEHDPHLLNYGLHIGEKMIRTKARLLPNPEIQFGNGKHSPGIAGRWDLRNRKFLKSNKREITRWGVGLRSGGSGYQINTKQLDNWVETFIRIFRSHGGQIRKRPGVLTDLGEITAEQATENLYHKTYSFYGDREPQLLIFVMPCLDPWYYTRVKKCFDTIYGVPSQVLQTEHIAGNKPQYSSNVSMKINAKLGGVTARVNPTITRRGLPPKCAIIGADVTHPSPGVLTPSLVGMCISNDTDGASYMGKGEGNGDRVEIIKDVTMRMILKPLLMEWAGTVGQGKCVPQYIYYFRDGVSEFEYVEVLNKEVPCLRKILGECQALTTKKPHDDVWRGKILVVIANKRHHLRVWPNPKDPKAADKNGNPVPGTLIDRDVTSPHGYDFLLYSHTALQGTARPVHYKVMMDEVGLKPEELQNMIYEQCYQYIRSTTPVSVHPAIYYAHLITARSRHHECFDPSDSPRSGAWVNSLQTRPPRGDPNYSKEFLMAMKGNENRLPYTMWWV